MRRDGPGEVLHREYPRMLGDGVVATSQAISWVKE
jgi:hypothetical protein